MPFKIVQTIEKSKKVLTVIPSLWEENGILWWPTGTGVTKLITNEFSIPAKDQWEQMLCVTKRIVKTYAQGEEEINAMQCISDTEDETEEGMKRLSRPCKIPKTGNMMSISDQFIDLNDMIKSKSLLPSTSIKPMLPQAEHTPVPQEKSVIPCTTTTQEQLASNPNIVILGQETLRPFQTQESIQSGQQANHLFTVLAEKTVDSVQHDAFEIEEQQFPEARQLLMNRQTIMEQQTRIETSLNFLIGLLSDVNLTASKSETTAKSKGELLPFIKPINSIEELNKFEEQLKEKSFLKNIVSNVSFVCGQNGKLNGIDCCYKLIDIFLDRSFLTQFSWTGNSREKDVHKIPLKFFHNFRKCFLEIIMLADKEFSEVHCENFFKTVIKNSVHRKEPSKISSTHKVRPSHLKYRQKLIKTGKTSSNVELPDKCEETQSTEEVDNENESQNDDLLEKEKDTNNN